jgi:hypothetical protein
LVLGYVGPLALVGVVALWIAMLGGGAALLIWPRLGSAYVASNGHTPRDFGTALYVAGDSMTTVGASDIAPQTLAARLFYTFVSVVGLVVITLTITYFLEVYNALLRRNTLALKIHVATAETGDAAEMVARLGSGGSFDRGYSQVAEFAAELTNFKESHHFYPVLFYFRFAETEYALSRLSLVVLDAVCLMRCGLSDGRYGWLKESAAVDQCGRSAMMMLAMLERVFLPKGREPRPLPAPDAAAERRWRAHYATGLGRLRRAGIETAEDEAAGAAAYVAARREWNHLLERFSSYLGRDMEEIDPAGREAPAVMAEPPETIGVRRAG